MKTALLKSLLAGSVALFSSHLMATDNVTVLKSQLAEDAELGATDKSTAPATYVVDQVMEAVSKQSMYEGGATGAAYQKDETGMPAFVAFGPWPPEPAIMAFSILEEGGNKHLYYLSEISETYDKQIKADSLGLCVNSRPRELVSKWDPRRKAYAHFVQLTKFVGTIDPATGAVTRFPEMSAEEAAELAKEIAAMPEPLKKTVLYTLVQVPLADISSEGDFLSFRSFLPIAKEFHMYVDDPENYVMVVQYDVEASSGKTNAKLQAMQKKLDKCMIDKPWEAFTYVSPNAGK